MKKSEKLLLRIRKLFPDLYIPKDAKIQRTRAKYNQLVMGSFKSFYRSESEYWNGLGLYSTANELLKCPNLVLGTFYGDIYIDCGCIGKCKGIKDG